MNNAIFLTFVDTEGPFLKIFGQTDKNTSILIEQVLYTYTPRFEKGLGVPYLESLQVGVLCCAKYKDNKYYRTRISSLEYIPNNYIEVNFIDYGNKDIVPVFNIRLLEGFDSSFISLPPQANSFILSELVCSQGEWSNDIVDSISKEIRYSEFKFSVVAQVTKYYLIKLFIGTTDLSNVLISKGYMRKTLFSTQEAVLLSMMSRTQIIPPQQNIVSYKTYTLEPGIEYPVYVSYISEGPCNFSVQLKESEDLLGKLMKEINSMTLVTIENNPLPGTICLARCNEDGHICRAVVTNTEADGNFKVFFVDFGNFESVSLESLFELPFKFVIPKVMAIRCALAGIEKSTVTLDMQCAFKQFVDNRLILMKVLPVTTKSALPKCELWDPITKVNAIDIIQQSINKTYPESIILNRGFNKFIKVTHVNSCNRFYVILKENFDDLTKLMVDIQTTCNTMNPLTIDKIKSGHPYCAYFDGDNQWYRCQVIEICDNEQVKVQYVDYGNEEILSSSCLKSINNSQLTSMKPQAIECCLNGYQNMESDDERDIVFEEIILEKEFTMKVIEMKNNKALVELIDELNYNVASILLDRIAIKRSQISPLLVQAGNKIEHRKFNNFKQDNRNKNQYINNREKQNNSWNDAHNNNSSSSWRQNNGNDNDTHNNKDKGNFKGNSKQKYERKDYNDNDNGGETSNWKQNKINFNNKHNDKETKNNSTWDQNNKDFSGEFSHKHHYNKYDKNNKFTDNGTDNIHDNNNWNSNEKDEKKPFNKFNKDNYPKKNRFNKDGNESNRWNSDSRSGYRKRPDFKREGSSMSSSGSENSFTKKHRKGNNFNNRSNLKGNYINILLTGVDGSGDAPHNEIIEIIPNAVPSTAIFNKITIINKEAQILISWFHNPSNFYVQLLDQQETFKELMNNIQIAYKTRKSIKNLPYHTPCVAVFPEDGVIYRAKIIDRTCNGNFKVLYVDFGNTSFVEKVWPIEQKFFDLPAQAICCSLNNITPIDNSWGSPEKYAEYFNKTSFNCKFIKEDDGRFSIDLYYENQNINEDLIRNGLVNGPEKIQTNTISTPQITIDIPLLVGQQFRAMITNINSLKDFTILLRCGVTLTCTIYNLDKANETFENILKDNLKQILIVYVDNIIENDKLEVTLYDNNGNLLKLLDKNEDTYDFIDLLCPFLVLNSTLNGFVTHVENPTKIYFQTNDNVIYIDYLLNEMYQYYSNLNSETSIKPVEGHNYAVLSSDGSWYRGRLISIIDEDKLNVNFIDYGNNEIVNVSSLREIEFKFMQDQVYCVEINLNVPNDNLLDQDITINVKYSKDGWEGVLDKLPSSVDNDVQVSWNVEQSPSREVQNDTFVTVSHIDSPNDFYIQLVKTSNSLDDLQNNLQDQVNDMPIVENPSIGALYCAQFSLDQLWYRAQVLDYDSDITTVRFVDYGNTDVLDNKTTQIKILPTNLLSLELYATRCGLNIKSPDDEWNQSACKRFEDLVSNQVIVEFLNQDEKINYVDLYLINGENIKDILIKENLAKLDDKIIDNNKCIGFISHLNSPFEFWIQLETCIDELESIFDQLINAETFPELNEFTPGTLCAALYPDDELWYRARIISNNTLLNNIKVIFIDYGNTCIITNVRQLPEQLIMLPPLAQKCCLEKPSNLIEWTPLMIEKFKQISADGKTKFNIKKLTTGETSLVELSFNGENIVEQLLIKTDDCYVKNFQNFNNLTLEINNKIIDEKFTLFNNLDDELNNKQTLEIFKNINNDGRTLFQVQYLCENKIQLYYNGIDIRKYLFTNTNEHSIEINDETLEQSENNKNEYIPKKNSESEANSFVNQLIDNVLIKVDENKNNFKKDNNNKQFSPDEDVHCINRKLKENCKDDIDILQKSLSNKEMVNSIENLNISSNNNSRPNSSLSSSKIKHHEKNAVVSSYLK